MSTKYSELTSEVMNNIGTTDRLNKNLESLETFQKAINSFSVQIGGFLILDSSDETKELKAVLRTLENLVSEQAEKVKNARYSNQKNLLLLLDKESK